jgi:DNA replication protein DnaD
MPEPECGWGKELAYSEEYQMLFALLGNTDTLKTLFLLYQRENKPFTPKLLVKELNISPEKAAEILESLSKYELITASEIELDDEVQTVYSFRPNPAFLPLISFANEIIISSYHKNHYYYFNGGRSKPYLK